MAVSMYSIYLAIRQGFSLSRMTTNNLISHLKFCYNTSFTFLNNPNDLDPSYKMAVDFWNCFEMKKLGLITEEIW